MIEEPHLVGKGLQISVYLAYKGSNRVIVCKVDTVVKTRTISSDLAGINQNARNSETATHQRLGEVGKPDIGVSTVETGNLQPGTHSEERSPNKS